MSVTYMLAQDGTELAEKLYRFRYRIYRYEIGVPLDGYREDRMRDEMDEVALNYVAMQNGNVIGGFRICDLVNIPDYCSFEEKYQLGLFRSYFSDKEISHVSRLAVGRSARKSPVMVRLFQCATREGLARKIRVTFADCSPHHLPLYFPIGYTPYGKRFHDPVFGEKSPILWVMRDLKLLHMRHSPLLEICSGFGDDPGARSWFHRHVPNADFDETTHPELSSRSVSKASMLMGM
ncbi:MAG: N-acyl amino acid synthase FeeM domain-containing protein [Halobacteriota archaeon]